MQKFQWVYFPSKWDFSGICAVWRAYATTGWYFLLTIFRAHLEPSFRHCGVVCTRRQIVLVGRRNDYPWLLVSYAPSSMWSMIAPSENMSRALCDLSYCYKNLVIEAHDIKEPIIYYLEKCHEGGGCVIISSWIEILKMKLFFIDLLP